jgi:hypothetical protein
MRYPILTFVVMLCLVPAVRAQEEGGGRDELFQKLWADSDKQKVLKEGIKILEDWFAADTDLQTAKGNKISKLEKDKDEAKTRFLTWLGNTKTSLGVDLTDSSFTMLEIFDEARVKTLDSKVKPGRLDYEKIEDVNGMRRAHEFAIWVPKAYSKDARIPLVIALHERVIDPKHPAFRGNARTFLEKGRQVLHDNWANSPVGEQVIVLAPTGLSDGFLFSDKTHYDDVQLTLRTMGEGLIRYRIDWQKIFLELHGQAIRIACEKPLDFAGFIVRDRIDNRTRPFIDGNDLVMLENLNGVPLLYIADEANWSAVGEPVSKALEAAYKAANAAEKLTVVKAKRDAVGALKPDPAVVQKFITENRRPRVYKHFSWRYYRPSMTACGPLELGPVSFNYATSPQATAAPLSAKCGKATFDVTRESFKDEAGQDQFYNRVVLNATEAEGVQIFFVAGLIDWALPVTIVVNGEEKVKLKRYACDWDRFFWPYSLPYRSFHLPLFGKEELTFGHVPQFVPPKPANGAGAEEGAAEGAAKGAGEGSASAAGERPAAKDG